MICRYPFPAAEKHDKTVFCGSTNKQPREQWDRNSLYHHIPKGKKALGDSAYEGVPEKVTVKRAGQDKEVQDLIDLALCRQETFHGRLRNFAILRNCFRHGKSTKDKMEIHETVSDAVLVITMYDLEYHPLFEVTSSPSEGTTQWWTISKIHVETLICRFILFYHLSLIDLIQKCVALIVIARICDKFKWFIAFANIASIDVNPNTLNIIDIDIVDHYIAEWIKRTAFWTKFASLQVSSSLLSVSTGLPSKSLAPSLVLSYSSFIAWPLRPSPSPSWPVTVTSSLLEMERLVPHH